MRRIFMICVFAVVSWAAVAQENAPKPSVSDAPLTSEQIAVYRAVLSNYMKGSDGGLNLANLTKPLEADDFECANGLDVAAAKGSAPVVHRIVPAFVAGTRIKLVDSDKQTEKVKENDPQNLLRKAVDEHEEITDKQLDQSLKGAFASGLFTLSEIAFDKEHRRAVVSFSFVCGGLCGHGNTLLLKKTGNTWKVANICWSWIS